MSTKTLRSIESKCLHKLRKTALSIIRYLSAINVQPFLTAESIPTLLWYFNQKRTFKRLYFSSLTHKYSNWKINDYPMLLDRGVESASLGEYFWQDLLVAREIIKQSPARHVDVGSRIDGFVAHISCTRTVEVFDIRPLSANIENVKFTQWDITNPNPAMNGSIDCVTCLHSLEHIGLGRYGDQLDPNGWEKGLSSLIKLLSIGGYLWLSVPIGEQRIEFNAHRVFNPSTIITSAVELGASLTRFFYLTEIGFVESKNINEDAQLLSSKNYGLGIFVFTKHQA